MNIYIYFALNIAIYLFAIHFSASKLAIISPSDVRIVWYFFSLSAVITFLLYFLARSYGALDEHGAFHGKFGDLLRFLLQASLGIEGSIFFGLGILFLIVVPQALSYILGGLHGCATSPILVSKTSVFVSWGFIKTFVVAAGVIIPLSICGQIDATSSWPLERTIGWISLGLMLIAIAFGWLYCHRGAPLISSAFFNTCPEAIRKRIYSTHYWMIRKQPNRKNTQNMLY